MAWNEISYFGSFQAGHIIESENPGKTIWNSLEHFGTLDFLRNQAPTDPEIDWPELCEYAAIRISQALEFRDAAHSGSPLTSPVSNYYSMLNLLRGFLVVAKEIEPTTGHGLRFELGEDLLSCSARVTNGTFKKYLSVFEAEIPTEPISLSDSLRSIVELSNGVANCTLIEKPYVCPVLVEIWQSGNLKVSFRREFIPNEFSEENWLSEFPEICGSLGFDPASPFVFKSQIQRDSLQSGKATEFCEKLFLSDLRALTFGRWFVLRKSSPCYYLPRLGNYLLAMFILSSVSRYEPQFLKEVVGVSTELGWLIRRFIELANRYYPQLVMSLAIGKHVLSRTV
jgi:hypothetical protein